MGQGEGLVLAGVSLMTVAGHPLTPDLSPTLTLDPATLSLWNPRVFQPLTQLHADFDPGRTLASGSRALTLDPSSRGPFNRRVGRP